MSLALTSNLTNNNIVNTSPTTFTITCTGASATANLTWYYSNSNGGGQFYSLAANRASITVASSQAYSGTTNGWYFPEANSAMAFKVVDSGAGNATAQIVITRTSSGGGGGTLTVSSSVGQISGTTSPTPTTFTVSAAGYSSAGYLVWYYSNDNNVTWNVLASGTSAVTLGSSSSNAINGLWFPEANSAMGFKVIDNGTGQNASLTVYRNPAVSSSSSGINVLDYGAKGDGTTDDTNAIKNAIAAASSLRGNILDWETTEVFFPYGTYRITDKLSCTNVALVGEGTRSIILGDIVATTTPMVEQGGLCGMRNIKLKYKDTRLTGSETKGQRVCWKAGDSVSGWQPVFKSLFQNVEIRNCGTAFYGAAANNPPGPAQAAFSLTFQSIVINSFSFRAFDLRGIDSTGCTWDTVHINNATLDGSTSQEADAILALDFDTSVINTATSLPSGMMSEFTISQLNCEGTIFRTAAIILRNCMNICANSIHLEAVLPKTTGLQYILLDNSCGSFESLCVMNCHKVGFPANTALIHIEGLQNAYGLPVTLTADNYRFGNVSVNWFGETSSGIASLTGFNVFRRGSTDAATPCYVQVGNLSYGANWGDTATWAAYPTSGTFTFGIKTYKGL